MLAWLFVSALLGYWIGKKKGYPEWGVLLAVVPHLRPAHHRHLLPQRTGRAGRVSALGQAALG
ncbi:MAG: hypothetical protein HY828_06555 [Actinobacteria bacterium]|nr:hypothetical protein [Actinomycetota bacterium]